MNNQSKRKGKSRFIQPIGFAFLLAYFIFTSFIFAIWAFWIGVALTILGTIIEAIQFFKISAIKRSQVTWVFLLGMFSKILLIGAITVRVYDWKNSVFILLGCIIVTGIWLILSQAIKPKKQTVEEYLDV